MYKQQQLDSVVSGQKKRKSRKQKNKETNMKETQTEEANTQKEATQASKDAGKNTSEHTNSVAKQKKIANRNR